MCTRVGYKRGELCVVFRWWWWWCWWCWWWWAAGLWLYGFRALGVIKGFPLPFQRINARGGFLICSVGEKQARPLSVLGNYTKILSHMPHRFSNKRNQGVNIVIIRGRSVLLPLLFRPGRGERGREREKERREREGMSPRFFHHPSSSEWFCPHRHQPPSTYFPFPLPLRYPSSPTPQSNNLLAPSNVSVSYPPHSPPHSRHHHHYQQK